MSPSSGNFYKLLGVLNFYSRIIKYKQILISVSEKIFNQVKIYSLDKFKVVSLHLTMKRLIIMIKIINFVKCWLKNTNFQPIKNKMRFSRSTWSNKGKKIRSLLDIILFIALENVEYNRQYLIR